MTWNEGNSSSDRRPEICTAGSAEKYRGGGGTGDMKAPHMGGEFRSRNCALLDGWVSRYWWRQITKREGEEKTTARRRLIQNRNSSIGPMPGCSVASTKKKVRPN